MKCHHHLLLHTDAGTVSFPHCTQALIYKPAEHEIQLFNHRLLVHNTPMMRAIHFTGSRRPVKRGEMHRVGPLNGPFLHVHVSVYLKSKLGKSKATATVMCENTWQCLWGQAIMTGSVSLSHKHTHQQWKPILQVLKLPIICIVTASFMTFTRLMICHFPSHSIAKGLSQRADIMIL